MQEKSLQSKPYRLINKIQHYAWGTKNEQAFIPKLLGLTPEPDVPYAELWMGAHPNAPSEVDLGSGKRPLSELIQTYPEEILGQRIARRFNNQLPFLFKVLSAGEALSIQAHPDKKQAVELHKRDPGHYPDDNHKPEIAIALDELTALVGFRDFSELQLVLRKYPEIADFVAEPALGSFLQEEKSAEAKKVKIKQMFRTLMIKSGENPELLEKALSDLEKRLQKKDSRTEQEQLFLELRRKYGADVGLFSIFLLNLIHLKKGQGVFLKAGIPHAYLKGNIIECMANSDNVVRAGLTPKFKDVRTLVEILTYENGAADIFTPDESSAEFTYRVPIPEFSVTRWKLAADRSFERDVRSVEILLVHKGRGAITTKDQRTEFKAGDSILIPASLKKYALFGENEAEIFCAFVP
ncbi:MAG: mannose-6-phosphate isomerase, class I [Calditrichaeota bacterium]|nr:mannose-6-phosphate isomerase, class I [Calditrichota bacterium]